MDVFLWFVIGTFIGGVVAWLYARNVFTQKNKTEIEEWRLLASQEREARVMVDAQLQALKTLHADTEKRMKESFEALAAGALQNNASLFLKMADEVMQKNVVQTKHTIEAGKDAIQQILTPVKEAIQKQEQLMQQVSEKNESLFAHMRSGIEMLDTNQRKLEKETQVLASALKAPQVRGKWGEIGLRRIIEFSGLNHYTDFTEQSTTNSDDKIFRPDMVIHMPGGKKILIDSKIPLNAFLQAFETEDTDLRNQWLAKHSKALQGHIQQLGNKKYWSQIDESVDFVVLYLPVEPALSAAMLSQPTLLVDALAKRIVVATPATLIAMLQTISFSWKQHEANENAMQILKTAKELYERAGVFAQHYQKTASAISSLTKTFNLSVGSWDARVMPSLRKLGNLGIGGNSSIAEIQKLEWNEDSDDNKGD